MASVVGALNLHSANENKTDALRPSVNGVKHGIANERRALLVFLLLFCFPLNYNFGIEGSLFGAVFLFTESVRSVRGVTVLEAGRKRRFACINTDKQGAGEQQRTGGTVEGLSPRRVMAHTCSVHIN